jgi:N,N'-diacetyllegionaminate synthase
MNIQIKNCKIGKNEKPFLIAEVAQSHDGSLGMAHAFIDAIAASGADAVKFQTHLAEFESTPSDEWRVKFSDQDKSRYDYWKRMEFSKEEWFSLKKHSEELDLVFLSSPFSIQAAEMLESINMEAWKIPSGEIFNLELINKIAQYEKPLLISTGLSKFGEISSVVDICKSKNLDFALFQCTSSYPNKLENVGINIMQEYEKLFGCPVGLSDHSASIYPSLLAMSLGASLIEVHVTFDKKMFGPDVSSSIDFSELKIISEAAKEFHTILQNPVDKDSISESLSSIKNLFTKSIVLKNDTKKGTVLTKDMLIMKKPGYGLSFEMINSIIGRKLKKDIEKDTLLTMDDVE